MDIKSTQFTRIAFIGAIANPNVGDEAILEENLRVADSMFGKDMVAYVFSKDPSYTALTSLGDIIPVDYLHRLTLRSEFDFDRLRKMCDKVIAYDPGSGDDADFEAIHSILSNIDVLHIIGGGYLNSKWPDMTEEVRVAALLARKYGARVIATGIGIYPMAGEVLNRFADIVDACEFVDFRDGSIGQLPDDFRSRNAGKLSVTTDDAVAFGSIAPERWLARIPHNVKSASSGDYLNVALHSSSIVRESGLALKVLKLADYLFEKGIIDHANLLGFSPDDLGLFKDLDNEMKQASCPLKMLDLSRYPAISAWYIVANARANIGSRYHLAVFSLAAGVPVLSASIENYYTYKLKNIHSQVCSESYFPISDLSWDQLVCFADSLDEIRDALSRANDEFKIRRVRKLEKVARTYSAGERGADALYENSADRAPIKVSVIVPIYNMERFLRECLDSILSQTLREIEVVCIDDGSTDSSAKILSEYSWRDKRVQVISQANSGVSAARNAGLKAARGEFVFFIDPDDWIASEETLSSLYWSAKDHGALASCGKFIEVVVGEDGSRETPLQTITSWGDNFSGFDIPNEGWVSYRDYQFDYGWIRFMYDRHMLVSNGHWFSDRKFYEDPLWFTRVMDSIGEFWATRTPAYCYRRGYKSSSLSNERIVDLFRGMTDILEFATECGYDRLWSLTYSRLTHDYAPLIVSALCAEQPDQNLEEALSALDNVIVESGGSRNVERIIIRNGERMIAKAEVASVRCELDGVRKELEATRRELDAARNEFDAEVARIKSSRTWKIGSAVWWAPRKIRDYMESR